MVIITSENEIERNKNDMFAAHLADRLKKHHSHKDRPVRKPHSVSLLSKRELGRDDVDSSLATLQKSLLHSGAHYFTPGEIYPFRGKVIYENYWLYVVLENAVYNLEDGSNFKLPPLLNMERVVEKLFISPFVVEHPHRPIQYLVLLTDISRLLFFDLEERAFTYTYQLPGHSFGFRHLFWNKESQELYARGNRKKDERHQGKFDNYPAVAMFRITKTAEIEFKYAFAAEPKFFGDVQQVNISNDILVCYCRKPDRVDLYNIDEIYAETCMNHEMPGYRDGTITVGFNLHLTQKPKRIIEIKGSFESVHFCRNFILLEPTSPHVRQRIINMCDISKQPILNEITLPMSQEVEKSCHFSMDFSVMHGCQDDSARLFAFEGIHFVCYDVQRIPGTDEIQLTEAWRTALNLPHEPVAPPPKPDEPRRSRSGRILKSIVPMDQIIDRNSHIASISNVVQQGGLLLVAVIYDKNTYSFFPDRTEGESLASIVFILDSMTGHMTSLATIDSNVRNSAVNVKFGPHFSHTVILEDDALVVVTADHNQSTVATYRLLEVRQDEPIEPKYTSNALNRKQRRRIRRGLPADDAQRAGPSNPDPDFHE